MYKIVAGLLFCVVFGVGFLDVYADESGAWLPSSFNGDSAGGSSSGGGCGRNSFYDRSIIDCTGVSWVYYEYVGGDAGKNKSIQFVPETSTNVNKPVTISGACARNGGGFWHFGRNGLSIFGDERNYFGDLQYLKGVSNNTYTYNVRWEWAAGHMATNNWKYFKTYSSWMDYKIYADWALSDELYYNDILMYKAKKFATNPQEDKNSEVFKDLKKAYEAAGKGTLSSFPNDVYAFCSWSGNTSTNTDTKYTLIVDGVYVDDDGETQVLWPKLYNEEIKKDTPSTTVTVSYKQHFWGERYEFDHWGTSGDYKCPSSDDANRKCTIGKMTGNKRIYAYYKKVPPLQCNDNRNWGTGTCGAEIGIKQSKDGVNWGTEQLYVKPGDKVLLKGWFNPQYQDEKIKLFKPEEYCFTYYEEGSCDWTENAQTLWELYDWAYGYGKWENRFFIKRSNRSSVAVDGEPDVNGYYENKDDVYVEENNGGKSVVGSEYKSYSSTEYTENGKKRYSNPKKINFWYTGDENSETRYKSTAQVIVGPTESDAVLVSVPYNFQNSTSISALNREESGVVYAGETVAVNVDFKVGAKKNSAVGEDAGEYATKVPNAKIQVQGKYGVYDCNADQGEWIIMYEESGLEANSEAGDTGFNEGVINTFGKYVNIRDVSAGTRICIRSGIYPASSGADDNTSENGFSGWAYSEPVYYTVAKKPSFQIWGSGLYSAGSFTTSVSRKSSFGSLNLQSPLVIASGLPTLLVFGSWAELGLVADGEVRGFSSGAATSYSEYNIASDDALGFFAKLLDMGTNKMSLLKSYANSFCPRSPLSFANVDCDNRMVVGGLNMNSGFSNATSNKSSLIDRFMDMTDNIDNQSTSIGAPNSVTKIPSEQYPNLTTIISVGGESGKDFVIKGDVQYLNYGAGSTGEIAYSELEQIPKLIIYAKNIYISCAVSRVDAILIADEEINTCTDEDGQAIEDVNDKRRSKQLKINGAIMASTLKLDRTYGAAIGTYSLVPAEIINYDSSLYLWSNKQAETQSTGKLTETYTRELAPRY